MFTQKHLERYADVLLWGLKTARPDRFKKGDIVHIRYHLPARPVVEILFTRLLEMKLNPIPRLELFPSMEQRFYQISDTHQLTFVPPGTKELFRRLNGSIVVHAPESMTHLKDVDPKKIGKTLLAGKHLRDILIKREETGAFGWTLGIFPTAEMARHANLSMDAYEKQIIKACFLNKRSPLEHWQSLFNNAVVIKKRLDSLSVNYYHIESANVDLKITPGKKRKWVGLSGHNIPSFEIFTSPDWRGTSGIYFADQFSYRSGNRVKGARMEFKNGIVVKVDAQEGASFLKKQLAMDEGAGRIGEFSLTDKRFSKIDQFMANTLFDENFGGKYGNCHIALGSSYSDAYSGPSGELTQSLKKRLGFNDSALHWDLVNTEKKRVTAHLTNGKKVLIYENGLFL